MPFSQTVNPILTCILACLFYLTPAFCPAQSELFSSHDTLDFTLEAAFSKVLRSRGDDREYFPATLGYTAVDGTGVSLELQIRTRGRSRSNVDNCRFPPLRLNFKRQQLEGTIFAGENILKLVTHCQSQSRYEEYVLKEYLNYRILNLFTDYSFRVRLLKITYIDSEDKNDITTKTAFLIEDAERMSERLGLRQLITRQLEQGQYDSGALNLVEIFEYMIGNTDWSVITGPEGENCCHNIVPLAPDPGLLIPVPYDFDATGLVDAPYSVPPQALRLRSVRQRLYRGFCHPDKVVSNTIAVFRDHEDDVKKLYEAQDGLQPRTLARAIDYLDGFYRTINDPARLQKQITGACRD